MKSSSSLSSSPPLSSSGSVSGAPIAGEEDRAGITNGSAPGRIFMPALRLPAKGCPVQPDAGRGAMADADEDSISEEAGMNASRSTSSVCIGPGAAAAAAREAACELAAMRAQPPGGASSAAQPGSRTVAASSSAPAAQFMDRDSVGSDVSVEGEMTPPGHSRPDNGIEGRGPWSETLARFPSLLRLYPLADSSEAERAEEEDEALLREAETQERVAAELAAQLEVDAPVQAQDLVSCSGHAGVAEANPGQCAEVPQKPGVEAAAAHEAAERAAAEAAAAATAGADGHAAHAGATPARRGQSGTVAHAWGPWQGQSWGGTPMTSGQTTPRTPACLGRVTPHSAPSQASGRWPRVGYMQHADGYLPDHLENGSWAADDLSRAWAEVERARQSLAHREREVVQREIAARRAEARNVAEKRQLDELRQRLDEYGQELEQGIVSLTAQQSALRDERRQTMEMQARVRRLCAAAVRDDVVASKARDWERRPWTPTQRM